MKPYQLIDEPQKSFLSKATVNPMWPLFSFMFGGALISWLWYAINSCALNSSNRNKELLIITLALAFFCTTYTALGLFVPKGYFDEINIDYVIVSIVAIELLFCYSLCMSQQESFAVHDYFNGKVANPIFGLIAAIVVGKTFEVGAIEILYEAVSK